MTTPRRPGPSPGGVTTAVLGPLLRLDPHRPRLTWYSGLGRTELSTASLANWSAKVAGLLRDELAAPPGATIAVLTTPSWQSAPILLGAWWAGLTVTDRDDPSAVAAFVDGGDDAAADEVFVVSGHPLGAPSTGVEPHQRDFSTAVLAQADRFEPMAPLPAPESAAVTTQSGVTTVADLLASARRSAGRIGPGGRVLSMMDMTLPQGVAAGLLGALDADGSLVQVTSDHRPAAAGLAGLARDERVTATLGVDVEGFRRLDG